MSKKLDTQLINGIRGDRLSQAIEAKQMRPSELLRIANNQAETYFNMSPQTLSQIMHGKRPLKYDDASIFARILDVSVDYLMGNPSAPMKKVFQQEKAAERYRMILNLIGSNIISYIFDEADTENKNIKGYGVISNVRPYDPDTVSLMVDQTNSQTLEQYKGIAVGSTFDEMNVSAADMESFYQDVCRFIEKRFSILKDLNSEEV